MWRRASRYMMFPGNGCWPVAPIARSRSSPAASRRARTVIGAVRRNATSAVPAASRFRVQFTSPFGGRGTSDRRRRAWSAARAGRRRTRPATRSSTTLPEARAGRLPRPRISGSMKPMNPYITGSARRQNADGFGAGRPSSRELTVSNRGVAQQPSGSTWPSGGLQRGSRGFLSLILALVISTRVRRAKRGAGDGRRPAGGGGSGRGGVGSRGDRRFRLRAASRRNRGGRERRALTGIDRPRARHGAAGRSRQPPPRSTRSFVRSRATITPGG